ncbi:serine hydrolase, partial [Steroidobacter sp.]|uniref:serine hydrolase n=1 Tax=Steroidobacter sp. TaxID=1978227 RepID=UPI001A510F24
KGDAVVYARGFGAREHGKPARIDPDTLFQVGSTTKAFTTAALGLLVEQGKLHWDDPVLDYLPDFQLQDPWLTRHLTVRDAVVHRSGIAETPYFIYATMNADAAAEQLRYIVPQDRFRDSFNYNNLMYGVAGKIVAAASGMSWGEFVSSRLLQPLGMSRSGVSPYEFWDAQSVTPTYRGLAKVAHPTADDARDRNVAMPHIRDDGGAVNVLAWQSYDNAAASGSIVSSARDMAAWMIPHLNDGRSGGRQVLQPATVRELHATQNLHIKHVQFPLADSAEGYAMGWFKARYHDSVYLSHGGGIAGFPAYVALMPDQRIGVVVLANSRRLGDGYAFHMAIALRAIDQLLKASPRNWSQELSMRTRDAIVQARTEEEKLQQSRLRNAPPSLPLQEYAGEYEDAVLHSGRIKIGFERGELNLSFAGEGAFSGTLVHWHRDVFRLRPKSPLGWQGFATFMLDETGKAVAMTAFDTTLKRVAPAP